MTPAPRTVLCRDSLKCIRVKRQERAESIKMVYHGTWRMCEKVRAGRQVIGLENLISAHATAMVVCSACDKRRVLRAYFVGIAVTTLN